MKQITNKYQTSDIKIASYILANNISLVGVDRADARKVVFEFPDSNQLKTLIQKYLTNRALVNPRVLFENLDYLKGVIYENYKI